MSGFAAWYAELRGKTSVTLLAERARETPDAVAYRAKHLGIYRERTWQDYARLVARCAAGLRRLDLGRGERVAIMGDACEEWMILDQGAQAAGAITYGIYPTASFAELEYQLGDGGAAVFIAESQEYVDKILALPDKLAGLRWIVVIDPSAMFAYDHPKLKSYEEVLELGGAEGSAGHLAQLAAALDPRDPAFIVYTSGTTGNPKGALISHGKHLAATANIVAHYPALAHDIQRTVIYLPLCHVLGRDVAITLPLVSRLVPHFGEDLEDLPQTLFEVAPTVLFAVPRYPQKFASQVLVGISNTSTLKRAVYQMAIGYGRGHARRRWSGGNGRAGATLYRLLHALAFRPVLNKLGFDQLRLLVSGGAPLPAETMALWQIWGVNVVEMYGQTETAGGIISGQRGPFLRPGDVGTIPEGWEVRLSREDENTGENQGEILVSADDLFDGYWNNPQATAEVIDAAGWLHTGDVGQWQEWHDAAAGATGATDPSATSAASLRIVDRARDFMVTSGGKTLSPSYIENMLRSSPYVAEAVVFGHARKYITALIEIDYDTVADWARNRNIGYTGFTNLTQHPDIERLLKTEIDRANAQLSRVEQVKIFRILPKALDPEEEGEPVTPTRKVKRKLMYDRFQALIESMYDDREERLLAQEAGDIFHDGAAGRYPG